MHNWTYWIQNLPEQALLGYTNIVGVFLWPLIFTAIIGYIYLKNQSVAIAAVGILIIFAAFTNALMGIEPWYSLMYILVALVITALFLVFLTKMRK